MGTGYANLTCGRPAGILKVESSIHFRRWRLCNLQMEVASPGKRHYEPPCRGGVILSLRVQQPCPYTDIFTGGAE